MRRMLKILHTTASGGLIGGIFAYMVLLTVATPETPATYADLREAVALLSNWVLLPSLGIALVSGLLSMVVHKPFIDKGWVWFKAALGILMFKGVLTIVSAKANYAASIAQKMAAGTAPTDALDVALAYEWATLGAVLAISVANVVLGVWRPRFKQMSRSRMRPASRALPSSPMKTDAAPLRDEPVRPAT